MFLAILYSFVIIELLAFISAKSGMFLSDSMGEGHWLEWWYNFIEKASRIYKDGEVAGHHAWAKPLGLCSLCFNVWVGILTFIAVNHLIGLSWWWAIPYVVSANFYFILITKVTNE